MDPLHSHKRPLGEDSGTSPSDMPSHGEIGEHHSKRIRLTLPPPPTLPIPQPSGRFQLPLPAPQPPSITTAVPLPPFSSQQVDQLPLPPIPLPPPVPLPRPPVQELPPIDSLASLPLAPPVQYNSNPMSVSSILINTAENPFDDLKQITSINNHHLLDASASPLPQMPPLPPPIPITPPQSSNQIYSSSQSVAEEGEIVEGEVEAEGEVVEVEDAVKERDVEEIDNDDEQEVGEADELEDASIANGLSHSSDVYESAPQRRPQLIIKNDESLNMEGIEEKRLGYVVYSPKELLPPLEFLENGILEVWIPSKYLTWENSKVRKRWLWGTDVYTDDSDVVAALIHTGQYTPHPSSSSYQPVYPDYDVCVTIRVLPKLVQYSSCLRNKLKSRSWGNHHGASFKIENFATMKEGEALGRSRGEGRKQRLQRFHRMRKLAFGEVEHNETQSVTLEKTMVLGFNNEGDPCYKYSPHLMSNQANLEKKLRKEVMILENDEERYEISYDEKTDKYRVAVILPTVHLGKRAPTPGVFESCSPTAASTLPTFPLEESNLEEILRDDLKLQDLEWNIVGVIIKDRAIENQSLLIVLKRMYWRKRIREVSYLD